MIAKEYLGQLLRYEKMINNKLSELYQLKAMSSSISVAMDSERVQTSVRNDKIPNAIVRIEEKQAEINSIVEDYVNAKDKIIRDIEKLTDSNQYDVLFKRYVEHKTFEVIATDLNYSWRQIIRIHGEALREFEKIINNQMS